MAWCPKCKNEYRAGIKICADCHVELVENLEDIELVKVFYGPEEGLVEIKKYLEYNNFESVDIQFDEEEQKLALCVPSKDKIDAIKYIKAFMDAMMKHHMEELQKQQEAAQAAAQEADSTVEMATEEEFTDAKPTLKVAVDLGHSADYTSNAQKAEDNKSSAYALLGIGVLGMLFVILGFAGVLPFSPNNKVLIYGVLGTMFLLFFIMGCVSFKNAKHFAKKAISENTLNDTIKSWVSENLTKEMIDGSFAAAGKTEEELYFYRVPILKDRLNKQFMNLDQSFLEAFIDDTLYDMIFGK